MGMSSETVLDPELVNEELDLSKVLNTTVELKPITVEDWHKCCIQTCELMEPHPLKVAPVECCICVDDITYEPHVRCLECKEVETNICRTCFRMGGEAGKHKRTHGYKIIDNLGPPIFENPDSWGCTEDLRMLDVLANVRIDDWREADSCLPADRHDTVQSTYDHLDRFFLRSKFGEYIFDKMKEEPLNLPKENAFQGECLKEKLERQIAMFEPKPCSPSNSLSVSPRRRFARDIEMDTADDVKHGRKRSHSSESLQEANDEDQPGTSKSMLFKDRLLELRYKYPETYFNSYSSDLTSRDMANKFDLADLRLLGYMPLRDDFEREFKDDAERLISGINFRKVSDCEKSLSEKFGDVVREIRIQRYNRILKARAAMHGVIEEHNLVNEFLHFAKNTNTEKGKYNVFGDERYFHSKLKEEEYKPLFYQMRQVTDRTTSTTVAKNIGKMELLMEQIEELKKLQKDGVTSIKGRMKMDAPPAWLKKKKLGRRIRKVDNTEVKKANLMWKRLIRFSKKASSSKNMTFDADTDDEENDEENENTNDNDDEEEVEDED